MDLGTIIGIVAGAAIILVAIFLGSGIGPFINVPSILIVIGGTIAATLIKWPLSDVMQAFKTGAGIAFKNSKNDPEYLVNTAIEMATAVRKNGLRALESFKVENDIFQRGIGLCADGHGAEVIKEAMVKEVNLTIYRQEKGEKMFRGIGDSAPAFGMLGTLVGLVQMLSNMSDSSTIGPAMAVAMLTTFYGALIANLIALPIADKLAEKTEQDQLNLDLIVESTLQIQANQNPMILAEMLQIYLPGAGGGGGGGDGGKGKKKKK
ncbi:MAG: MotA/TolQ/ExbB proton channel family protein [Rhodospirillaceae bacterium]